jgi:hypothetical protein
MSSASMTIASFPTAMGRQGSARAFRTTVETDFAFCIRSPAADSQDDASQGQE